MSAQSFKVQMCATRKQLARAKSTATGMLAAVGFSIEKTRPMIGVPWSTSTSLYRMQDSRRQIGFTGSPFIYSNLERAFSIGGDRRIHPSPESARVVRQN